MNRLRRSPRQEIPRHLALAQGQVACEATRCVQCGICSYNCPVSIDVRHYAWRGLPVSDPQCILCGECVRRCPRAHLTYPPEEQFAGSSRIEASICRAIDNVVT